MNEHFCQTTATGAPAELPERVYAEFQNGAGLPSLSKRYGRTESQLRRLIRDAQYQHIASLPLDYMPNPKDFNRAGAERTILAPAPQPERAPRKARRPSGLPPYLADLYETPLLTAEQERHLFRQYNYLKHLANRLRESLDPKRPSVRAMDEIERLYVQAVEVKNQLIRANLRLVVSIAKKYVSTQEALFELVSEGNESLMRAVEKFDYSFGNKFSTYATWAIKKNFARSYNNRVRQDSRFRTSHEETLDKAPEQRSNPYLDVAAQEQYESDVVRILACLSDREREIVVKRFGLTGEAPAQTLQQVGADLGVTKERIRQIEKRAMLKLREAARQANIEFAAA
jgi:RNA polymerase primary sigma factor/RNA polymerase sigma factor